MKTKTAFHKYFKRAVKCLLLWHYTCQGWRVTYKNGEVTYMLPYREAKSLQEVFGGKLWFDWNKYDSL
jgi:hypothetical protein